MYYENLPADFVLPDDSAALMAAYEDQERAAAAIAAMRVGFEFDDAGASNLQEYAAHGLCLPISVAHVLGVADSDGVALRNMVADIVKFYGTPTPNPLCQHQWTLRFGLRCVALSTPWQSRKGRLTADEVYDRLGDCIVLSNGHASAIVDGTLKGTYDDRFTDSGRPRRFFRAYVRAAPEQARLELAPVVEAEPR